jgi:hypothetical protein
MNRRPRDRGGGEATYCEGAGMGCEVVANDTEHVLYAARECNKLHEGKTM